MSASGSCRKEERPKDFSKRSLCDQLKIFLRLVLVTQGRYSSLAGTKRSRSRVAL